MYKLQAIVSHVGMSATSGHYISYILSNKKLYLFDDVNIKEISTEEALKQQAYILFYERKRPVGKEVS